MNGQYTREQIEQLAALVWQDVASTHLPAVPWTDVSEYHRNQFMRTVSAVLKHARNALYEHQEPPME